MLKSNRERLAEEAVELAEAKTHSEILGELADLLYFTRIVMSENGFTPEDVSEALEAKSGLIESRRRLGLPRDKAAERGLMRRLTGHETF